MISDKKTEKAFELAEQFEFMELSDKDKKYILSVMTEEEYNDLRKAIFVLPNYFVKDIEPVTNIPQLALRHKKNQLKDLIFYPLQFYKVAASIIITFLIFSVYHHMNETQNSELIAQSDTVFIHRTDTVFQILHDTVWVVEKKNNFPKQSLVKNNTLENEITRSSYNKDDLHPDDVEKIIAMTNNNCLANDSVLKNLLELLN
jgi:hypothetical protein